MLAYFIENLVVVGDNIYLISIQIDIVDVVGILDGIWRVLNVVGWVGDGGGLSKLIAGLAFAGLGLL